MTDDVIARWADLLVDYCVRVEPGETILLGAELEARRLVEATYRSIVLRGAHPLVRLDFPELHAFYLENASEAQLGHITPVDLFEAGAVDAEIRIKSLGSLRVNRVFDPRRVAIVDRAHASIRHLGKAASRWVVTQYPTPAFAEFAGMELEGYEDFVCRSMFLDHDDPSSRWMELRHRQSGLLEFMTGVSEVRIEGEGTDLTLSTTGRTWINSDGRRNMPSGEIFTGPIEDSANGRIHCSFPVLRGGRRLSGIELELVDGLVVEARAQEGDDYLRSMLDMDPGARRLGELGIGLNYGIDRFTGSILYDEKIGGTVHLALGQSYPETGATNQSALHWDLIVDLRESGRVLADGSVVMENGKWRVG
ncbi:MAG: leucyl aminopeptidase [Planctomycetota bacterium]|nr:leucyl aminopeptidase [Planctomycetota bacterium]